MIDLGLQKERGKLINVREDASFRFAKGKRKTDD